VTDVKVAEAKHGGVVAMDNSNADQRSTFIDHFNMPAASSSSSSVSGKKTGIAEAV